MKVSDANIDSKDCYIILSSLPKDELEKLKTSTLRYSLPSQPKPKPVQNQLPQTLANPSKSTANSGTEEIKNKSSETTTQKKESKSCQRKLC